MPKYSFLFSTCLAMVLFFAVTIVDAKAQCVSPAPVGANALKDFDANPGAYLAKFSNSAAQISAIRNLAVSSPDTVAKIIALASAGSGDLKSAIGTGLGQAAKICVTTQPAQAQSLQQAVLSLNDQTVAASFQAITGDVRTAAVQGAGGGPAGGGPAGGGPGGAGTSSSNSSSGQFATFNRTSDSFSVANSPFSFNSSGGSSSTTTTTTTTAATSSVSP